MGFEFIIYDNHFRTLCVSSSILPQANSNQALSNKGKLLLCFNLGVAYSPQTLKLCSPLPVATLEYFYLTFFR